MGPLFQEWLDEHYPLKASRVESAIREMRGGRLYRSGWGERMRGSGPIAKLISARFARAQAANGLDGEARMGELRTDLFRAPSQQESLF